MTLSRRTRSRIFWCLLVSVSGVVAGFLYHSSPDLHTRIFSVGGITMLEAFIRPRRWLITPVVLVAALSLTYALCYQSGVPGQSVFGQSLLDTAATSALSAAGGIIVGVIGRRVFASPVHRSSRDR